MQFPDSRLQLSVGGRRSLGGSLEELGLPVLQAEQLTGMDWYFIDDEDVAMVTPGHKASRSP